MKNDCIFCAIAAGEIPSLKIYEDDEVYSFLDINPFSAGHALVIPKKHVSGLEDADDGILAALMPRVRKIAAHIRKTLPCDGFNILQNNGEAAGQTVRHLHFHIIPRMTGDALAFAGKPGDKAELERLAARLCFV